MSVQNCVLNLPTWMPPDQTDDDIIAGHGDASEEFEALQTRGTAPADPQ